jgi:hypothetical protein
VTNWRWHLGFVHFALHISSLLTLLCIDGEVAWCRRGTLDSGHTQLVGGVWESGHESWAMVTR